MGFFRNGSPFLGLGLSLLLLVVESVGSSVWRRVPAGRRPVGEAAELWRSVGVLKDAGCLLFLTGWGGGLEGAGGLTGASVAWGVPLAESMVSVD